MRPPETWWEVGLYVSAGLFLASWLILIFEKASKVIKGFIFGEPPYP